MKPHGGCTESTGEPSFLTQRWLRWLAAMALTLFLLGLPIGARAESATSAPRSGAHVYLLRGVLNIFSLGLDQIAAKLQAQGIIASVDNYLVWSALADEAAAEYKSGQLRTIILVGHSSGATALPDMVARLSELGVPVALAIGLDSLFHTSLSGRVGRYINFYIANGAGTPVERTKQFHGDLENVDVENIPGIGHVTIDKNQIMQQRVISAIDAVVFSHPTATPAKQTSRTTGAAPAAAK
jgi:hypothetical protein